MRKVVFQVGYTTDFHVVTQQDTTESSCIESSSVSDAGSTPAEGSKDVDNKISIGIDVHKENSKEAFERTLEQVGNSGNCELYGI